MGRNCHTNNNNILAKALEVFAHQGYHHSSLRELEAATQLHPGSIYHRFGSKQGLYLAVLDYYWKKLLQPRLQHHLLRIGGQPGIEDFFNSANQAETARQEQLLIRAMADASPDQGTIYNRLQAIRSEMINAFAQAVVGTTQSPDRKQGRELLSAYLGHLLQHALREGNMLGAATVKMAHKNQNTN